ncbi:hypothetical protein [Pedobacter caeni]|uniref:Uncharacterized protein n=1 Tax=Pedobacter caeni TaxID=288992 RepID=A0A1M5JNS3_9SPHI|nr:hypothetical protein [Pedobacter caeni]SHG42181.1 hypothetical protein SAMN04488522_105447 [Pedobacter caeni]
MTDRSDFLLAMYNQLCSEMDRHIKITWQIVGVLLSTLAVFALVDKNIMPLDIACSIILGVCALAIGIIIESNFWYNRNLVIIANIERQFLLESDSKEIQHYFTKHRSGNTYIDMMLIQMVFVIIVVLLMFIYHTSQRVVSSFSLSNDIDYSKTMPTIVILTTIILAYLFHKKRIENYNTFVNNSPGKTMSPTTNIPSDSDHITT